MFYEPTIYQSDFFLRRFPRSFSEKEKASEAINKLISKSQKVLLTISALFPFDLFPDKIIVDETKVKIIKKSFFRTTDVTNVLLKNITDVEVFTNPFFATIRIRDRSYLRFPRIFEIGFLRHKEAFELAKLIQGLIETTKENVDYNEIDKDVLKKELEVLGESVGEET